MSAMRLLLLVALVFGIHHGWQWLRGDAGDGEQAQAVQLAPDDPRLTTGEDRIVMLAADWCGYCAKQRKAFERANVRYRLLNVDEPDGDRAMQALGAGGVPVTIIGQQVVHGYQPDVLQPMLDRLGYRNVF